MHKLKGMRSTYFPMYIYACFDHLVVSRLAPGTIHPRFGKTAGHDTPSDEFDPLQAGKVAMAEDSIVTKGSGRDNEIAAQVSDNTPTRYLTLGCLQADAAREHLLNALTTRAQQMSMQCASNDTVRALLVKQKKVSLSVTFMTTQE